MTRRAPRTALPNRCLIVADGARARLFTIVEPLEDEGGTRLLERHDLINPDADLRRFARDLATTAREFVASHEAGELIIAASPRFLGMLRAELRKNLNDGTRFVDLPTEMTSRTPADIEAMLVRHRVLRAAAPAFGIYRPRAQPAPEVARRR